MSAANPLPCRLIPETKGRSLEEMDELFGATGFAQADLETKARIEREIGLTALLGGESDDSHEKDSKDADGGSSDEQVEKSV